MSDEQPDRGHEAEPDACGTPMSDHPLGNGIPPGRSSSASELLRQIARLARGRSLRRAIDQPGTAAAANPEPGYPGGEPSAYEQVTRRGLEDLTREVERLELKVNALLVGVASTLLVEVVKAVLR